MRLFVAVEVGPAARAQAVALRRAVDAAAPELSRRGMKWVEPANLHLTLRFIGDVSDALAAETLAAFGPAVAAAPFDLAFGGAAWLPDVSRPRVLMLPVSGGAEELLLFKRTMDARLPGHLPAEEVRAFRPHLTLARVRDGWQREMRKLVPVLQTFAPLGRDVRVEAAVLFESQLGPQGPVYHERARASMRAS